MASLSDGKISQDPVAPTSRSGEFKRGDSSFRGEILKSEAQTDRYHLYVSYACPWAHRTLIMRNFKELESIIPVSVSDPFMGDKGWTFTGRKDPKYLAVLYVATDRHYTGKVSVPVLWDKKHKVILNNESSEIIRIFNHAFDHVTGNDLDFYPEKLRGEIDEWNDKIYETVNNGVYKAGFAKSQRAYEKAFHALFETLDELEAHLKKHQTLVGDLLTEADLRLFTTLIRFDAVYYSHFKCNLKRMKDYPHLFEYLKSLYQREEIRSTCHFDHIKRHYFESHTWINPTQIVPRGPDLSDLERSHDRGVLHIHRRENLVQH